MNLKFFIIGFLVMFSFAINSQAESPRVKVFKAIAGSGDNVASLAAKKAATEANERIANKKLSELTSKPKAPIPAKQIPKTVATKPAQSAKVASTQAKSSTLSKTPTSKLSAQYKEAKKPMSSNAGSKSKDHFYVGKEKSATSYIDNLPSKNKLINDELISKNNISKNSVSSNSKNVKSQSSEIKKNVDKLRGKQKEYVLAAAKKADDQAAAAIAKNKKVIALKENTAKGNGRSGKQARLRELANDPKLGKADRGWIKQEQNAIALGNRKTIRNPPGKDLAHERGRESAKGYGYKHSSLQDRTLHRTQHKYDNFGQKNKERPLK